MAGVRRRIFEVSLVSFALVAMGIFAWVMWRARVVPGFEDQEPPVLEAPDALTRHEVTFLHGIEALEQNDGRVAAIALRSFSFGDRPIEEYRLYYLANAHQLEGDLAGARRTLAELWRTPPLMNRRDDAGLTLAGLYADRGDWSACARTLSTVSASADHHAVAASAAASEIRALLRGGDPGGALVRARTLMLESPVAPESDAAIDLIRRLRSISPTDEVPMTLPERIRRTEKLLELGQGRAAFAELSRIDTSGLPSPWRERALLALGRTLHRLERYEDSEQALGPLFSIWYRYAIPALMVSASNFAEQADSVRPARVRTIESKRRIGTRTVRRGGRLERIPWTVTQREQRPLFTAEATNKRDRLIQLQSSRLRDVLSLPVDAGTKVDALSQLVEIAREANDEDALRTLVPQLTAIDPGANPALQRFWDQAWERFVEGDFPTAADQFDFIRATYGAGNPAIRRQAAYWLARSMESAGETEAATRIYDDLVATPYRDLYALFAEDRGGVRSSPPLPSAEPEPLDWPDLAEYRLPAGIQLAWELNLLGLDHEAIREIQMHRTPENEMWANAVLSEIFFARHSYHLASIYMKRAFPNLATADQDQVPPHFLAMYYMIEHESVIREEATGQRLDPWLVTALIRQESSFDSDVESVAGAVGLMQLLPSTAREVAHRLRPSPDASKLDDPEVNIALGSAYLRALIDLLNGNELLAVAGYNGGPYRIRRWWQESPSPLDEFLEGMPLSETRNYVKRVVLLRSSYSRLRG